MNLRPISAALALASLLTLTPNSVAAPNSAYGRIEVLRDRWGIPHVFSATDQGALYGLGHATADERGFQMTYNLRLIQGRLAELVGDRLKPGRKESALDHDRKMRTFGWSQAADRAVLQLDVNTRQLLEAYCEGVNDSFAKQKRAGTLHPLFQRLSCEPEPWTAADCLLSWWHLAQFFAGDGTRDLMVWRNRVLPRPGQPQPPATRADWSDDTAAVVQRADVSDQWVQEVEAFVGSRALGKPDAASGADGPKFSHAWVVGGPRSTTGAAVLVSDPQTPVRNPSLWMEFHLSGQTFNARGIGVPGSPGLLIGFNRTVAWGLTALGADQADLFRLETSSDHPDTYRWNDSWRSMEHRTEQIKVKGGLPVPLTVRESHLGPIASEFCFRQPGDPEVALKRVPICETSRDTIQAVFAMMRARKAPEFARALGDWHFPSAHCVYGDADGHIGYAVLAAIPIRPRTGGDPSGNEALRGRGDEDDWQGYVPPNLLPQLSDPRAGVLFSANHRAIASFYPVPLGLSTGSMGDTIRSWRLRERLAGEERLSPADVLDIHYDSVNPARREIARLGLHLRKTSKERLSDDAAKAVTALELWLEGGSSSDLASEGAELANRLSTFFRFIATPLTLRFGGGESGLARFLKSTSEQIRCQPELKLGEEEIIYLDKVLSEAWRGESSRRDAPNRAANRVAPLGWFDSLDGFGSLDHQHDVTPKNLTCLDGQTIRSQAAQSYTQWVPLHDTDQAQSICPIGHSDRLESRYRTSTLNLWQDGQLHPAPLTRQAVEALTVEHLRLADGG